MWPLALILPDDVILPTMSILPLPDIVCPLKSKLLPNSPLVIVVIVGSVP